MKATGVLRSSTDACVRGGIVKVGEGSLVTSSGWNPDLARLEHDVLADPAGEGSGNLPIHERAMACGDEGAVARISSRSSLVSEVLGTFSFSPVTSTSEHVSTIADWCERHLVNDGSTIVVRAKRYGFRCEGWDARELERSVGASLYAAGWSIDLHDADIKLQILLLNASTEEASVVWDKPWLAWGVKLHSSSTWEQRTATNRPFFKPVSLDPRLARAMVNIACPNGGRLLDPFCGTGGILIEGILSGLTTFGSDLDPEMVRGCADNLEWARTELGAESEANVRILSAENAASEWGDEAPFDGFAFDPPYGRNSWKTDDGWDLFRATLSACAALAAPKANLVTLLPWSPSATDLELYEDDVDHPDAQTFARPWRAVREEFEANGWSFSSYIHVPVHGSLSRLLVFLERG